MLHILASLIFITAGLCALAVIVGSITTSADRIVRALTMVRPIPPLPNPAPARVRIMRPQAAPMRAGIRAAA